VRQNFPYMVAGMLIVSILKVWSRKF